MKDLRQKAVKGAAAKVVAQAAMFVLRLASLVILARLLEPTDFGLVAMVTALTGVLSLFKDFGLSMATVQRDALSDAEYSALFWLNIWVGSALTLLALVSAPAIAVLYHEPRLLPLTVVLALGFLFNAAGVQHNAILEREMRFTRIALIEVVSWGISAFLGVGMAAMGYGYWSLAIMTVAFPFANTVCVWMATPWVPGRPRWEKGVAPLVRFGGTLTLNSVVVYVAYNFEKVLLGRFWGADAIGLYGRAYQLVNMPIDNINSAIGGVAFSGLSRLQNDPTRFRNYFLKGYSIVLSLSIPVTFACGILARDVVLVVLGKKWIDAAILFQYLTPTMLVLAVTNPFGWVLFSLGMVGRSLKIGLALAPVIMFGYLIGLSRGPSGVALGYSAMMLIWVIPHIMWSIHGTVISKRDVLRTVSRPLFAAVVAAGITIMLEPLYVPRVGEAFIRLVIGASVYGLTYLAMLMYVMGQRDFYTSLIRHFWTTRSSPVPLES
jgi:O-antigen/teichoic acid export membrane protein